MARKERPREGGGTKRGYQRIAVVSVNDGASSASAAEAGGAEPQPLPAAPVDPVARCVWLVTDALSAVLWLYCLAAFLLLLRFLFGVGSWALGFAPCAVAVVVVAVAQVWVGSRSRDRDRVDCRHASLLGRLPAQARRATASSSGVSPFGRRAVAARQRSLLSQ